MWADEMRCTMRWDGPRSHVCACKRDSGHQGRHVCKCRSWMVWRLRMTPSEQREACWHPQRYRAESGKTLCEPCRAAVLGWKECRICHRMNSKGVLCEDEKVEECPDCSGQGWIDCDEFDCHGEYCELGEKSCRTCYGTGEVPKENEHGDTQTASIAW